MGTTEQYKPVAGYCGSATAGDYGSATAGNYGFATAGYCGFATAGDSGSATAGDSGTALSRYYAKTGEAGLAVAYGSSVKVCGGKNAILVIATQRDTGEVVDCKTAIVDGEKIKANTWYHLVDGKFVECEE